MATKSYTLPNGRTINIPADKKTYSLDEVQRQSREWQRKYYDYLYNDRGAGWFWAGLDHLNPQNDVNYVSKEQQEKIKTGNTDQSYSGGELQEIVVTPNGVREPDTPNIPAEEPITYSKPTPVMVHYDPIEEQKLNHAWKYGGYYKGKYIHPSRYANLGNEVAAVVAAPIIALNPATGMLANAAWNGAATVGETVKWGLTTPAGQALTKKLIGDALVGTAGYMFFDAVSNAVTGKTIGQNVADAVGYIPGLRKIPYQYREFLGNMVNPGGWLTWGRGSQFANYLYNQGKNLVGKGFQYVPPHVKSAIIANKLNRQIKNTKLAKPLAKLDLQDGYLFHNGHMEVRPAGHNGKKVYVTKQGNDATHVMSNLEDLPISQVIERYEPSYYVTKQKPVNSVIEYTFDPISGAPIPHMPGKVLNNKMSYEEILTHPIQLQSKSTPPKTSLAFFERLPANISKAERLGLPKGMDRTIVNNEQEILANAKAFAEKYGYDIPKTIGDVKDMYRRHNRWFRSVYIQGYLDDSPYIGTQFDLREYAPELSGLSADEIAMKFASRGYPKWSRTFNSDDIGQYADHTVFAAPNVIENLNSYGSAEGTKTVMLQRPFSFKNPLTWHIDADYHPVSQYYPHLLTKGQTQIGNTGPKHEIKLATKHLIPVKIAEPTDKGTLLGEYLGNVTYKSGGSIHIKKNNVKSVNYLNYFN